MIVYFVEIESKSSEGLEIAEKKTFLFYRASKPSLLK